MRTYGEILSNLRLVMISKMPRPEEVLCFHQSSSLRMAYFVPQVLIVENEEGEIVREELKDTDSINLYKSMRECLVYLTNLVRVIRTTPRALCSVHC